MPSISEQGAIRILCAIVFSPVHENVCMVVQLLDLQVLVEDLDIRAILAKRRATKRSSVVSKHECVGNKVEG